MTTKRLVDLIPNGDTITASPSLGDPPTETPVRSENGDSVSLGDTVAAMAATVASGTPEGVFKGMTPEEVEAERQLFNDVPTDLGEFMDQGMNLNIPKPDDSAGPRATSEPPASSRRRKSETGRAVPPKSSSNSKPPMSDELTGLFATGFIVLVSFTLGDDFLPTEHEATAIARPLANIMARRIDLAAKLGRDANDTIALAIALMSYGVRVGPIAAGKTREWNDDRKRRNAGERVLAGPPQSESAGSVGIREDAFRSPSNGATPSALNVAAQAGNVVRGVLDRDLGGASNGGSPLDYLGPTR